ncbi:lysosomal alpha-mannosidase-like [Periplaneta americana]|uniref:lysosomal alpha-mannosidase-like n=1 Tax=Periplaneta americana TaxID=6978 RepID=UPI0037E7C6BC
MASISHNTWIIAAALLLVIVTCFAHPRRSLYRDDRADVTCGYQSCHQVDPTKLNVHLVPHTHDDVGWLKTVDQYYYGANTNYQRAGVQYILDSVIEALLDNPDRRFIYVETAFFWKWWVEQTPERQQEVKDLVNEGRLEFIGGAWSMNDEAATHYQSTVDQFTWGLRKLNDTFGSCGRPHIGWQIDPFGHSREMASIFARMGYDAVFFARLDYQDKNNRLLGKTAELIWEGSPNLGASADLFTNALYNHYSAPAGFCFDILCNTEPFIDNQKSPDYNVDAKVQDFVNFVNGQAQYYTSKNVIVTMGDDFNYQDALMYFKNMDKLIKYVNAADKGVNIIYSTPSCYVKAVNDEGLTYTTKQDDFFPYATDGNSYWTGYFNSRPTIKYFERLGNNFLQVVKQLEAMTMLGQAAESSIDSLREAMGVMQHHDAVTGTELLHVAKDYSRLLTDAFEDARGSAKNSLNQLIAGDATNNVEVFNCLELNVSSCDLTENQEKYVVTVYNPLSHEVDHFVRLPVPSAMYTVQGPDGALQTTQMVPIPKEVLNSPERKNSIATHDLVFKAENLPPLGFRSYYVTKTSDAFEEVQPSSDLFIGKGLEIAIDETTGLVKTLTNNGVEIPVAQNFFYYNSFAADNQASSGAYLFRPDGTSNTPISDSANIVVYKGDIVDEIHQTFSDWASQVVRIYHEENHVEFEWLVGPIPTDDGIGKEVVSQFTTNLDTQGLFYTDSNGRELLERKRDFRPTWDLDLQEPISGNYYPITSKILIRDVTKGLEFAVLNDRAQGGSSILDGQVELMVNRRLVRDEGFQVGEALYEEDVGKGLVARGRHYVMAGAIGGASPSLAAQEREVAQRKLLAPWLFFSPGGSGFDEWQSNFNMEYSGLKTSLPSNIQILTLEPWKEQTLLLRLEHILEENEDTELSKPADVAFEDLFTLFVVSSSHETTLAANQWAEDMQRLEWKSTRNSAKEEKVSGRALTLSPMEIETYVINVEKRSK